MKIYVGNLSFDTSEETLRGLVADVTGCEVRLRFDANVPEGKIQQVMDSLKTRFRESSSLDVNVVTDRDTGRPRGFAFVTMPDDAARAAIAALNGKELDGRTLNVNEAKARTGGSGRRGGR